MSGGGRRRASALATGLAALGVAAAAHAAADLAAEAEAARAALERGAHDEAIAALERLADRGVAHPDVSFNRAAAYLARAATPQARPGDRGQAAAALEETLALRGDDAPAATALEATRFAVARQRARRGLTPTFAQPPLGRAALRVLPEPLLAGTAALGSAAVGLGLGADALARDAGRRRSARVAALLGALVLAVAATLLALARADRVERRPAVVVAESAPLLDAAGRPTGGEALPESASVHVLAEGGGQLLGPASRPSAASLVQVEWGDERPWVHRSAVRLVVQAAPLP